MKLNTLLQRPEFAFEVIMIAFFEQEGGASIMPANNMHDFSKC